MLTQIYTGFPEKTLENDLMYAFYNYFIISISLVETPPAAETPVEEQAPAEEAKKEDKKSIFASFCGCFGAKSDDDEEPAADEEAKEDAKPAEDEAAE